MYPSLCPPPKPLGRDSQRPHSTVEQVLDECVGFPNGSGPSVLRRSLEEQGRTASRHSLHESHHEPMGSAALWGSGGLAGLPAGRVAQSGFSPSLSIHEAAAQLGQRQPALRAPLRGR